MRPCSATRILTAFVLLSVGRSAAQEAVHNADPIPAIPATPAPGITAAHTLGTATAEFKDGKLTVTTGAVTRVWNWTGAGLSTVGLRDDATGSSYAKPKLEVACDWNLPGLLDNGAKAELVGVEARTADDDDFSGKFVETITTVRYPDAKVEIQHVVWAIPGAPGIRTQLRAKALPGYVAKGHADDAKYNSFGSTQIRPGAQNDHLPLDFSVPNSRRYFGIYNDPGNRLPQDKPMLEEKLIQGWPVFQAEAVTWASGEAVQYDARGAEYGVIAVKESPKAVNQPAYLTGAFFSSPTGLSMTGWGLAPQEIVADRFRDCWATWSIVYSGGNDGQQKALKQFDIARYPVDVKRDAIILSNTWGPANPGGMQFTSEDFVLKEIEAVGKLGIDVMQIDDGWQKSGGGPGASNFLPKYKNGWKDIKAAAEKAGVRMGLWMATRNSKTEELCQNVDELGYVSWKADFEHLFSRDDYENRYAKYRTVMKRSWGNVQFTLCPEYDAPRYGWYNAQEYGSLYFQNIQEGQPIHLTFVPFQVLRQHWFMAKYFPANKLQVMLQNPERTRKDVSDAHLHRHDYCFAMGLAFVPEFFQSAQYLSETGKQQLLPLIAAYKTARPDIFTSTTYPIGEEPNNASWTGFQMVSTTRDNGGHLLLFRELHSPESTAKVQLKFLAGKTLALINLLTGEKSETKVDADGKLEFTMNKPGDFRLLRYEVK